MRRHSGFENDPKEFSTSQILRETIVILYSLNRRSLRSRVSGLARDRETLPFGTRAQYFTNALKTGQITDICVQERRKLAEAGLELIDMQMFTLHAIVLCTGRLVCSIEARPWELVVHLRTLVDT